MVEQHLHALYGVVVADVEPDGEHASRIADAVAQLRDAIVVSVVVVHADTVNHRIGQRRIGSGIIKVMADLIGCRVNPHVQGKQLADIGTGWRLAIFRALQIAELVVRPNDDRVQVVSIVLTAIDLVYLVIVADVVVDLVEVGDVDA